MVLGPCSDGKSGQILHNVAYPYKVNTYLFWPLHSAGVISYYLAIMIYRRNIWGQVKYLYVKKWGVASLISPSAPLVQANAVNSDINDIIQVPARCSRCVNALYEVQ